MRIKGKQLREPTTLILRLLRGENEIIEIHARAVLDYDEFLQLCPIPNPPDKLVKGKGKQPDFEHPHYKSQIADWAKKKGEWMVLKSLLATPDLEWDLIDMSNPDTWGLLEQELKDSGFSDIERQRILSLVVDANGLNEDRVKEAMERFLLEGQSQGSELSSHKDGQVNTSSGERVNGSASVPQESQAVGTN